MSDKLKKLSVLFVAFSPAIIPAVIAVIMLLLTGCLPTKQESYQDWASRELKTIEYNGCEYVTNGLFRANAVLVHKGNCKYCAKRKR